MKTVPAFLVAGSPRFFGGGSKEFGVVFSYFFLCLEEIWCCFFLVSLVLGEERRTWSFGLVFGRRNPVRAPKTLQIFFPMWKE